MTRPRLQDFFEALEALPALPHCGNPWRENNEDDGPDNGPARRRAHLETHAARPISLILIGEAAGYQGCRISGMAFTSEALLIDGAIPGIAACPRLSTRERPWSEPSARVVWRTLYEQGLAGTSFLWNALPLHPYAVGNRLSNRTPTRAELEAGTPLLLALRKAWPDAALAAVGNKAAEALTRLGLAHEALRHPAYGGVPEFVAGVERLATRLRAAQSG